MIKIFDRVRLIKNVDKPLKLPAGTIATCRNIMGTVAILQYSFDNKNQEELFIGIPMDYLEKAVEDEIVRNDYKLLLPKRYHKDNLFLYKNKKFRIEKVDLKENEMEDILTILSEEDNEVIEINMEEFQLYASFISFPLNEFREEPIEDIELNEQQGSNEDILISIGKYQFQILDNNTISLPHILDINELENYRETVNKLIKLLGGH